MQSATLSDTYKLIWFLWNVTNDFKHVKLAWFFFFFKFILKTHYYYYFLNKIIFFECLADESPGASLVE